MSRRLIFTFLFASLALCGCRQDSDDLLRNAKTFTGVIEGQEVRTYLSPDGESYHVYWKAGDRIAIKGDTGMAIYEAISGDSNSTEFKMVSGDLLKSGPYTAYYPESAEESFSAVQEYAEGTASYIPMMAVSDNETLSFKNLGSIIRLGVKTSGVTVKSLCLSADQPLAGKFTVSENAAVISEGTGIVVSCGDGISSSDTAVPVFVSIPAGSYTNLYVTAYSADGRESTLPVRGDGKFTAQRSKWHELDLAFETFVESRSFDHIDATLESDLYSDGKWAAGDAVCFFETGREGRIFELDPSSAGTDNARIINEKVGAGCAVWPASAASGNPMAGMALPISLPETQAYVSNGVSRDAMVKVSGIGSEGTMAFKNINGILQICINGIPGVSEVRLTTLGKEALWGEATVDVSSDDPKVSFASTADEFRTIVLKKAAAPANNGISGNEWFVIGGSATITDGHFDGVQADASNTFRFAVPAGSLSQGFRITVIDAHQGFMQKEFPGVTLTRGAVTDAGTMAYTDQSEVIGRTDVPNKAYYKDIFMDSGIELSQNPTMPIETYLNLKLEHILASNNTTGKNRQQTLFCGSTSDLNGVLLYPDGAPRFRMMYVSGGGSNAHGLSLETTGREAVRRFFNAGGCYVGSCAGAYLSTHGVYNYSVSYSEGFFGLWPGIVYRTSTDNVYLAQDIPTDSPLLKYYDFGGDFHVDSVRHHNGPYFAEYYLVPGTEVLSRFDAPSYRFDGEPGVIAYKENPFKGRVIAIGSHPEQVAYGENLEFMAAIAKYALDGFGVARLKAVLRNGQTRVMDKSTKENDPAYTMIGDLQCHHFAFALPEGARDINITMRTDSKFNLSLRLAKDTYAFREDAEYRVENISSTKKLHFDSLPAGIWYIGVQCEDTVTATKNTNQYDYTNTEVLNGVPYSISINWK